jgi:hypothetical protein
VKRRWRASSPEEVESEVIGHAEIRATFKSSKFGTSPAASSSTVRAPQRNVRLSRDGA